MANDEYVFQLPASPADDPWIRASGGDLPHPVDLQVVIVNGRPVVSALRIENGQEVTSSALRKLRIPHLARAAVADIERQATDLDPGIESVAEAIGFMGPLAHGWTDDASARLTIIEEAAAASQLRDWLQAMEAAPVALAPRGRGAKPPTDDEYRTFARAYLEESLKGAHRAKERTAHRLGMNRSTVYAWIKACRDRGLLPKGEDQ